MKFLIFLVMLFCIAYAEDLSGKMFTFSKLTRSDHVKITPKEQDINALTICHRSFTDLRRQHSLFSLSLPTSINAFVIFVNSISKISIWTPALAIYEELEYSPNKWHSICTTWDSKSAVVQMWVDGQPLPRKYICKTTMKGQAVITLGQEQDSQGGSFDIDQSFTGMMTDVHMWDYVLSPDEIHNYMNEVWFTPGNMVNWRDLNYLCIGKVLLEDRRLGTSA